MVVYAVMTKLCEYIWYMKSDCISTCLKGLVKTVLFQEEYNDAAMSWINIFIDISICATEPGIDNYKKSRTRKTLDMILLPVTCM